MKKIIFFLSAIIFITSCDKNNDSPLDSEIVGNWILVEMSGSIPNSQTSGSDMEWQEIYTLKADGTFQKSRDRNGIITQVSGTYGLINSSNETLLKFTFDNDNEIIGSCHSDLKEFMLFQSENTFSSTWLACDGPGLVYKNVAL